MPITLAHYPPTISFNTIIGLIIAFWLGRKIYFFFKRFVTKKSQGDQNPENYVNDAR